MSSSEISAADAAQASEVALAHVMMSLDPETADPGGLIPREELGVLIMTIGQLLETSEIAADRELAAAIASWIEGAA